MTTARELARAAGLDKLTDEHLAQLERAAANMARHVARLPKDLPTVAEPAHIYQAALAKERGR
ncbi:MAG TPA: hypothetical protein VMB81_32625 [Candidatus Sulfotelmatobacter sp.]|nr:hypothetical protein [Candidatus Sulfotelmatobacter sp.]